MSNQTYASDQPISSKEEDLFNRWPFAVRVAETVANRPDPSSLIVAIYGPWGDGKTSVLKMMEECLAHQDAITVVSFNPWYFEGQSDLVKAFFHTIADALGVKLSTAAEGIGSALKKYGSLLSSVPGLPDGTKIGEALSNVTLDQLRVRIEAALNDCRQRVIVLVDDIDRLDRNEIHALFKLIKLSAGFRNVCYVLAFDEEVVAASLGERYGAGGAEAGRRFLEKIVQVPLHLPPPDRLALRQIASEGIDSAIKSAGIELSESDAQMFGLRFIEGLDPRMTTPRQVKRYVNAISFAIPLMAGEVHVVDQLLIEGIRVFYPAAYDIVRRNPDVFLASGQLLRNQDGYKVRAQGVFEEAVRGLVQSDQAALRRLLTELFPRLQAVFGNRHYGEDAERVWGRQQRICAPRYFDRYFRYGVPATDISDRMFAEFLEAAESGQNLDAHMERFCQGGAASRFIERLRGIEDVVAPRSARSIARAVAKAGINFPVEKQMLGRLGSTRFQAAVALVKLLKRIPDEDRCTLALELTEAISPLPLAVDFFWWLCPDGDDKKEPVVPDEFLNVIGGALARRIEADASSVPPYLAWPEDSCLLLQAWRDYGESESAKNYIVARLDAEPGEAVVFLASFVGNAWELESGRSRRGDFRRENYNSVVRYVPADTLVAILRAQFGDSLVTHEFYQTDSSPIHLRVARQFAFIHEGVMQEAAGQPPNEDDIVDK